MRTRTGSRATATAVALVLTLNSLVGLARAQSPREREWEEKFRALPQPERLKEAMRRVDPRSVPVVGAQGRTRGV